MTRLSEQARKWKKGVLLCGALHLKECVEHAAAYQRFVVVHGTRDSSQALLALSCPCLAHALPTDRHPDQILLGSRLYYRRVT